MSAPIEIVAVTRAGSALAARLAPLLGGRALVPAKFAPELPGAEPYAGSVADAVHVRWPEAGALVLVMATGIAVRAVAPLLAGKASDPAVICLDEAGRFVVPLLGGHQARANALAGRIAASTGGQAVVTTASDGQGLPALDTLGAEWGWRVGDDSALTRAMAGLVNGEALACYVDPALPGVRAALAAELAACPELTFVEEPEALLEPRFCAGLLFTHRALPALWPALRAKAVRYNLPLLVVGVGCKRGVPADELYEAVATTLDEADLDGTCVAALATAELKADEPGLLALAEALGVPLEVVPAAELAALDPAGLSPSAATERFALPGVAEPCALVAAGGPLLAPKRSFARCTVAVALRPAAGAERPQPGPEPADDLSGGQPGGALTLVGIGPGSLEQLTGAARAALEQAEVVTGYKVYIELVRPLLAPHQELIVTPAMGDELGRARQAIALARSGRRVALISSGDIGIYAMAGPVFEELRAAGWRGDEPPVAVLPGISAFQALAARLGAPISHDFCLISLSDLLTPWPLIERRVAAAAAGDFVVALYNPRSRERHWQLGVALELLRARRPPDTPVALGRNVDRRDEAITVTTLAEVDPETVDMFTVLLIGNSRSYRLGAGMATPRGYEAKAGGATAQRAEGVERPRAETHQVVAGAYPIVLTDLNDAVAVVVGGGPVGECKARGLLAAGAEVRLVSPEATPQLREWAACGSITWLRRPYCRDDLAGAWLAFAATDRREVNAAVAREAAKRGVLCNVADAPDEGTFRLPAVYRGKGATVAVSTDGASPARAKGLRDAIARWIEERL